MAVTFTSQGAPHINIRNLTLGNGKKPEKREETKMFTPLRIVYTAIDFLAVIMALVIAVPFFLVIASPFLMGV
jgi:hypothetical protein